MKWYSTKEKMPMYDVRVLIYTKNKMTYIGCYDGTDKCWCIGDFCEKIISDEKVIAWTEIPKCDLVE